VKFTNVFVQMTDLYTYLHHAYQLTCLRPIQTVPWPHLLHLIHSKSLPMSHLILSQTPGPIPTHSPPTSLLAR
jgi:hypothetical protein